MVHNDLFKISARSQVVVKERCLSEAIMLTGMMLSGESR